MARISFQNSKIGSKLAKTTTSLLSQKKINFTVIHQTIFKMPEISRFYGIIIKMFFNEHNPPHFHVEYQDFKAIITIKEGIVEGKMPKIALKLIFEWMELHKEELLKNWENIENKIPLNNIDPLI